MGDIKVPFVDLVKQHETVKKDLIKAFQEAIDTGGFILGKPVETFEESFSQFIQSKYAVGVGNGTDALMLSLTALNIKKGDEVITTPFTFFATTEVILNRNATPVFVDIDPVTFNIDTSKLEEKISKRTKVILPVHLYGQVANMEKINEIAKKYNLYVIEDAAQAVGALRNNKKAGSFGDFAGFSFYPTKNLSALGDGGIITTSNEQYYEKLLRLRKHGASKKYYHEDIGFNSRLDAIQASFLNIKIKFIEKWNKERREIASIYTAELKNYVETPIIEENCIHIFHQYTIRTPKRDKLMKFLKERNIATQIHYPYPLHLQPALAFLDYHEGDLPESERASKEVLSLPVFPEITDTQLEYVIDNIKKFFI